MAFNIGELVTGLFKPAADLVDDLHTSKEEKLTLKNKLNEIAAAAQGQVFDFVTKMAEHQAGVITAEATSGDAWVRRWRPALMWVLIAILVNNYLFAPWLHAFGLTGAPVIVLPDKVWTLLEIGVGGYVLGRSGEKIADRWNK